MKPAEVTCAHFKQALAWPVRRQRKYIRMYLCTPYTYNTLPRYILPECVTHHIGKESEDR